MKYGFGVISVSLAYFFPSSGSKKLTTQTSFGFSQGNTLTYDEINIESEYPHLELAAEC